jgi:hypothetical protein
MLIVDRSWSKGGVVTDTNSDSKLTIARMILIPSLITLAVTLLRLAGELQHWSTVLFNPEAGGIGSLIGITWLVPVFGIYFALKLSNSGAAPERPGRSVLRAIAGIGVIVVGGILSGVLGVGYYGQMAAFCLLFAVAAAVQYSTWPALFKTLLAYGYAARIPVAIVMFFAMKGDWHTHYDVVPPESPPEMNNFWPKYFWLGFLPQLIAWVGFTVLAGSLFGSIATAIVRRRRPAAQAASA